MGDTLLQERYARVLDRLDAACAAAGRSRQSVRLIAVSKLHPAESLAVIAAAGQIDFGENYVQEALQKRLDLAADPATAALCAGIRWHMIGHVQSRKAAQEVPHVMAEDRKLASRLAPSLELFDGCAIAGREHPALALGGFLCLVFT